MLVKNADYVREQAGGESIHLYLDKTQENLSWRSILQASSTCRLTAVTDMRILER